MCYVLYAVIIMLYMYHDNLLILQTWYPPRAILRYVSLLWFGIADMLYLVGRNIKDGYQDGRLQESPYESNEQYGVGNSADLENTLRILKEEIRIFKVDNDIIIRVHEKLTPINVVILQSLSNLQRYGPLRISHEQEDKTNVAYCSRSHGGHGSNRDDMMRDGRLLVTLDRRGDRHRYYSSYSSYRHYDHHRYHPYKRSDRGYFLDEFKKENPPKFDGELKKSQDA